MNGGSRRRSAFAISCLGALALAILAACVGEDPALVVAPGSSSSSSGGAARDGEALLANDGGLSPVPDAAMGPCPLPLLDRNPSFEVNDGRWALSGPSTSFVTTSRSGSRSLELGQGSGVNFAFAKQDLVVGRTHVRLWYRQNEQRPAFHSLKLEIQPDGVVRTFGAPWPQEWTCATARVESGDGGAGTFFVSGYQPDRSAGSAVLVDDLEIYALPTDEVIPKECECPPR